MTSKSTDRLNRLRAQLVGSKSHEFVVVPPRTERSNVTAQDLNEILPQDARAFLADLCMQFQDDVDELHANRQRRQFEIDSCNTLEEAQATCTFKLAPEDNWTIDELPEILRDRRVDIGDISPARNEDLIRALNSGAQGVQVDFDDGHCPTWRNTILGHRNLIRASLGNVSSGNHSKPQALLIVRPRAWNMEEENVLVGGQAMQGALFDFGVHMFHSGVSLWKAGRGPFFYLSKLESASEAALWDRIFSYTERYLGLPHGAIKATVLIEHIFAVYEMDSILYELRHHSSGLNCGMWDYTASILCKFRAFRECTLPDRQTYVSMQSPFLTSYMRLLIQTCHRRNAPATSGMAPFELSHCTLDEHTKFIQRTKAAKGFEVNEGIDGTLVFDSALVPIVQEIFTRKKNCNDLTSQVPITSSSLLHLPNGHVTLSSVYFNLRVVLHYIVSWFQEIGVVVLDHCVEDSATAEISRAQLWSWIKYKQPLEGDTSNVVTMGIILELIQKIEKELKKEFASKAIAITIHLLTTSEFPPFLATFLQKIIK